MEEKHVTEDTKEEDSLVGLKVNLQCEYQLCSSSFLSEKATEYPAGSKLSSWDNKILQML